MSWTLVGRPKTIKATKALAEEFEEMEPAPHDRPLSERRLQVYERMLQEGAFRPVTWSRALCKETGVTYRINGKHTSVMLAGLDEMPEFFVTVEDYECDTLEDVARLYATFDNKTQSRTISDINHAFAGTVPELACLSSRLVNLAVGGMSYQKWLGGVGQHGQAERAELMLEHPDFVVWLAEVISAGSSGVEGIRGRHIRRLPVAAAMFASYGKSKAAATEFWSAVRDETGAKPSAPDRKLARYLLTMAVASGRGASKVYTGSVREFYVKCLHAWNAWRRNETTDLKYFSNKDIPSVR